MTPGRGIENGTHWWEASALTTAPSRTAKSMWADDKNLFVCVGFKIWNICVLQDVWWKWTFWEQILPPRRTVRCRTTSVASSLRKCRKKGNTRHKWRSSQLHQKPTSSKEAVKKKLFRMNCPITSLWNKQTYSWCETSFSGKHEK